MSSIISAIFKNLLDLMKLAHSSNSIQNQKKATCNQTDGFQFIRYFDYPFKASAPPTISKISLVIAAWRALL